MQQKRICFRTCKKYPQIKEEKEDTHLLNDQMSENSPIKDALYARIENVGQEQIHQLLLNGKFSELFEKIGDQSYRI